MKINLQFELQYFQEIFDMEMKKICVLRDKFGNIIGLNSQLQKDITILAIKMFKGNILQSEFANCVGKLTLKHYMGAILPHLRRDFRRDMQERILAKALKSWNKVEKDWHIEPLQFDFDPFTGDSPQFQVEQLCKESPRLELEKLCEESPRQP